MAPPERDMNRQTIDSTDLPGSSNAAMIKLGPYRDTAEVWYDVSTANDDIHIDVSADGNTWRNIQTLAAADQTTGGAFDTPVTDITYTYIRVYGGSGYADGDINLIEISGA